MLYSGYKFVAVVSLDRLRCQEQNMVDHCVSRNKRTDATRGLTE